MADHTRIEWTDATWNPITGCSVVSAGCKHCYAMKLAGTRLAHHPSRAGLTIDTAAGPVWTGEVRFNEAWLDQPLRWRRPRRIFVCAHGDLFHEAVPDEWICAVFAVMAASPQHTFQVLTKRPARAVRWFQRMADRNTAQGYLHECLKGRMGYDNAARPAINLTAWPLPNVWLGVSVENQAAADERIPLLLQCPAAVRWISAEPLLAPVDLRRWGDAAAAAPSPDVPKTWAAYTWPEWIPATERALIERFWSESHGRSPVEWIRDNALQMMPATGARVGLRPDGDRWNRVVPARSPEATMHGRYVHRWNNIGVVVADSGEVVKCSSSCGPGWLSKWLQPNGSYRHELHWVVVGGESGAGARPMHPAWARSLRDQCAAAGVAFLFKQWGEWIEGMCRPDWEGLANDGTLRVDDERLDVVPMSRVGKSSAGRILDGEVHDAYPGVAHG